MNSTLTRALCSLVVCLTCVATPCFAQSGPPGDSATGRASVGDPDGDSVGYAVGSPFGPQVGFDARMGNGIGWNDGYYSANALVPLHFDPGVSMIFGMINLSVTGKGDGVINLGSGYRYRHPGLNRIFGFYGFADLDDGHDQTYKRVGVGVESLGKYFDMRANAYRTLGDSSNTPLDIFTGTPFFQGNFLVLNRQQIHEEAYSGADFEVGGLLPYIGRYGLSAHVGPYYLSRSDSKFDQSTLGVKGRVTAQVNEDLAISANFSNDDIFSNNAYLQVSMTLPDGRPTRWFRPTPVKERMAQAPVREWRVPVHRFTNNTPEALINPADGQAFLFAHIFPNNAAEGNGTIESPFNSTTNFVNNPAYDVIYVRPGNPLNLDNGFVLSNNQRLLSTAVTHQIVATQGTFTIPGFTGGVLPRITNPNLVGVDPFNPVIQLASNNEVSGFQIDGSNGVNPLLDGIRSQAGGIGGGFNINRNTFTNNRRATDIAFNGNGYGRFDNNTLTGTGAAQTSDGGFRVVAGTAGSALGLLVSNNVATGYQGFGEDLNRNNILDPGEDVNGNNQLDRGTAFEVTARDGATINAANPTATVQPTGILNNVETASGTGLLINGVNGGVVNAQILNNIFQNNVDINTGARVVASNGTVNLVQVVNNNISSNNGNGMSLVVRNGGLITGNFTGNVFNDNVLAGLFIDGNDAASANNGVVTIDSFTDNIIDRTNVAATGSAGILINMVNANLTMNNVLRNNIANGTGFGIGGRMQNGFLNLFVGDGTVANQNILNANGDAGIGLILAGNNVSDLRILRNQILDTVDGANAAFDGDGINLQYTDTATYFNPTPLNLTAVPDPNLAGVVRTIDQNTITGNDLYGIVVSSELNSVVDSMVITRNFIDSNGFNGMQTFRTGQGAFTNFVIAENTLTNQGNDGIWLTSSGANSQDTFLIARNNISFNNTHAIHLEINGNARQRVDILNNNLSDNGDDGIFTSGVSALVETPDLTGTWNGNTLARNTGNAIFLNVAFGTAGQRLRIGQNGVDANGASRGNLIQDNGGVGILIGTAVASGAVGNVDIQNNTIMGNGANLAANSGAGIDINLTNLISPSFIDATIDNNVIRANIGDGVEMQSNGTGTVLTGLQNVLSVQLTNNQIILNESRGVDVLTAVNSRTDLTATGNNILGNLFEGFYVINTSSAVQNQTNNSNVALDATGLMTVAPVTTLDIQNNTINANGSANSGLANPFAGGGLAIRVGTSDITNGTLFVSQQGLGVNQQVGGVRANVVGNTMLANFGSDAYFDSFVSTVASTAAGVDPLARLDLNFTGNTLDVLSGTNAGAFYNNAVQVKSPAGLMQQTRRRNAQRFVGNTTGNEELTLISETAFVTAAVAATTTSFSSTANPDQPIANAYATTTMTFQTGLNTGAVRTVFNFAVVNSVFSGINPAYLNVPSAAFPPDQLFIEAFGLPGLGGSTFRVFDDGSNTINNPGGSVGFLSGGNIPFVGGITNGAGGVGELDFEWQTPGVAFGFPPFP